MNYIFVDFENVPSFGLHMVSYKSTDVEIVIFYCSKSKLINRGELIKEFLCSIGFKCRLKIIEGCSPDLTDFFIIHHIIEVISNNKNNKKKTNIQIISSDKIFLNFIKYTDECSKLLNCNVKVKVLGRDFFLIADNLNKISANIIEHISKMPEDLIVNIFKPKQKNCMKFDLNNTKLISKIKLDIFRKIFRKNKDTTIFMPCVDSIFDILKQKNLIEKIYD